MTIWILWHLVLWHNSCGKTKKYAVSSIEQLKNDWNFVSWFWNVLTVHWDTPYSLFSELDCKCNNYVNVTWSIEAISRSGRLRYKGMLKSFFLKLRASFTLLYPSPLAKLPVKRTNRHTKWANWYSTRENRSDTKYISSTRTYESGTFSSTHAR